MCSKSLQIAVKVQAGWCLQKEFQTGERVTKLGLV